MTETETVRAFTSSYEVISNRLINQSVVKNNEDTYEAKTLWDTGATISCISHDVVQKLKLISTGKRAISTPSGAKEVDTYLVDIELLNGVNIDAIEVCETEIGKQEIDLLVGMDIINRGDFSVSNHNGKTVFTFSIPSMKTIDFAKKISVHNIVNKGHSKPKRKH